MLGNRDFVLLAEKSGNDIYSPICCPLLIVQICCNEMRKKTEHNMTGIKITLIQEGFCYLSTIFAFILNNNNNNIDKLGFKHFVSIEIH